MYTRKTNIIFLILIIASAACRKESLPAHDYVKYIENANNGLLVEQSFGDVKLSALYKPYDYMLLKETKEVFSDNTRQQAINELSGFTYFTFKVSSVSKKSSLLEKNDGSKTFYDKLEYCSFGMQNDFALVDGKDTIPCSYFHFERNYNLAPYNCFLLGFERSPVKASQRGDILLIYNDKLFGLGQIKFKIDAIAINNIPHLKNN